MHSPAEVDEDFANKQPTVLFYNSTKSGVDVVHRMVRTYSCKHMKRRWPITLFCNMIAVSAINAFIVWLALNGENSSPYIRKRRAFLIQLGKELAGIKVLDCCILLLLQSEQIAQNENLPQIIHRGQRKPDAISVKEAKTKNPAPLVVFAKILFVFNIVM